MGNEWTNEVRGWLEATSRTVKGFARRKAQDWMILAGAKAMLGEGGARIAVIEAPTGVGKSLGYAIPGLCQTIRRDKTVVIATATVALQRQLAADLQRLQDAGYQKFRFKVVKGIGRYVCDRNLHGLAGQDPAQMGLLGEEAGSSAGWKFAPSKDELAAAKSMLDARLSGEWDGDMDAWRGEVTKRLKVAVTTSPRECAGKACPFASRCGFMAAKRGRADADVLLVNHAVLLADVSHGGGLLMRGLKDCILVVDEAHKLPDAATEAAGAEMVLEPAKAAVTGVLEQIAKATTVAETEVELGQRDAEDLTSALDTLKGIAVACVDHRGELAGKPSFGDARKWRVDVQSMVEKAQAGRAELESGLDAAKAVVRALRRIKNHMLDSEAAGVSSHVKARWISVVGHAEHRAVAWYQCLARVLSMADKGDGSDTAVWVERDARARLSFHLCPVDVSGWLADKVWRPVGSAVVTSATLCAMGGWSHFLSRTGLSLVDGVRTLRVPSPFDLQAHAVLRVPSMRHAPSQDDQDGYAGEVCRSLADQIDPDEATLILCASEKLLKRVEGGLPKAWRDRVLVQGERSIGDLVSTHAERVRAGRGSILMGMATLAEGVDLKGDLCKHVVVVKVPFAVPTDPITAARAEWLEKRGLSSFALMMLPEAHRRLVQSCGRLIRSETDTGRITVYDNRLLTKAYGRRMIEALPPYRRELGWSAVPDREAGAAAVVG